MTEAIRLWSEELARDPASLVFVQLSDALRRQGRLEVALTIALRGVERHPYHAEAHDVLARIAVDRYDVAGAAQEWETVLRLAPDHVGAMKGLSFIRFQQGRPATAERFLARAAECGAPEVATGLKTVRGSSQAPTTAPQHSAAQRLFADLLLDDGQTAILLDASGYVLGGLYVDSEGIDVGQEIGEHLSGITDEVTRAMRHLDIGSWTSMLFETPIAVVAMAPGAEGSLLVVAATKSTPLGLLRRLMDQCAERAAVADGGITQ